MFYIKEENFQCIYAIRHDVILKFVLSCFLGVRRPSERVVSPHFLPHARMYLSYIYYSISI